MKIPETEPGVDKEWDKLENLPSWDCQKKKTKGGSGSTSDNDE